MNELDIRKEEDVKKPDLIRFADETNGFEASYITRNEEGFEFDSAYVKAEDFSNLIKALKKVKSLGWDKKTNIDN